MSIKIFHIDFLTFFCYVSLENQALSRINLMRVYLRYWPISGVHFNQLFYIFVLIFLLSSFVVISVLFFWLLLSLFSFYFVVDFVK